MVDYYSKERCVVTHPTAVRGKRLIQDYLGAVDSAVKRLFEARADYYRLINTLFKDSLPPIFVTNRNNPEEVRERDYRVWLEKEPNKGKSERAVLAKEKLSNEQFALSVIDGSLLQVAFKAIKLYSENSINTSPFENLNKNYYEFSVGKKIRGVPSGLIIYAGRNHYNHLEDGGKLRKPTKEVIDFLNNNYKESKPNILFNFDSDNKLPISLATNFVSLLGWDDEYNFKSSIEDMIGN